MRNMAALIGSGVMDRYPQLRIGTLEAGHSWLPFWMARLDEHAHSIATALPSLKHKPSDYVLMGAIFRASRSWRGPSSPKPSSTSSVRTC